MKYMAYDEQNKRYLALSGTQWVPSSRFEKVRPAEKKKVERMIAEIAPVYDGSFACVPYPEKSENAAVKQVETHKQNIVELHNMDVDESIQALIAALDSLVSVSEKVGLDFYSAEQSKIDLEISNIYHRMESGKPNAPRMVQTYKELRDLLKQRRKIKNAIAVLSYLKTNPGLSLTRAGLNKIKSLSDRSWMPAEDAK